MRVLGASLYLFLRYLKYAYWEYIYILIYKHNYSLVLFFQHIFTNIFYRPWESGKIASEESDDEDLNNNNRIMAKILVRKNAEKLCDNFASEESSDSEGVLF